MMTNDNLLQVRAWPQSAMTTDLAVLPEELPTASIALTTSMPLETLPKTTCLPSSHAVCGKRQRYILSPLSLTASPCSTLRALTVHRKNWLPLVPGPALACGGEE